MLKSALSTSSLKEKVAKVWKTRDFCFLLPVTLNASKNGDIVLCFHVPQPKQRYLLCLPIFSSSSLYLRAWSLETERSRFGSFGWNLSSLIALPGNIISYHNSRNILGDTYQDLQNCSGENNFENCKEKYNGKP